MATRSSAHAGARAQQRLRLILVASLVMAAATSCCVDATDAESLLDFCVADRSPSDSVRSTGYACKKPADVVSSDFKFTLTPAVPAGRYKFGATVAFGDQWAGVNSLSSGFARVDFAEGGLVPPHTHPRGTELLYVLKGTVQVGFVASDGTLYQETVVPGQLFAIPRGLIHFAKNVGKGPAAVVASFNSQNPGLQLVSASLLASSPRIGSSILAQDWNVQSSQVDAIAKAFLAP